MRNTNDTAWKCVLMGKLLSNNLRKWVMAVYDWHAHVKIQNDARNVLRFAVTYIQFGNSIHHHLFSSAIIDAPSKNQSHKMPAILMFVKWNGLSVKGKQIELPTLIHRSKFDLMLITVIQLYHIECHYWMAGTGEYIYNSHESSSLFIYWIRKMNERVPSMQLRTKSTILYTYQMINPNIFATEQCGLTIAFASP